MVNKDKWYIEVHELLDLLKSDNTAVAEYRQGNMQALGFVALALIELKPYEYDEIMENRDSDDDAATDRKNFVNNLKGTVNIYKKDRPDSGSFRVLNAIVEETINRLKDLGENQESIEIIYSVLNDANIEYRNLQKKIKDTERIK